MGVPAARQKSQLESMESNFLSLKLDAASLAQFSKDIQALAAANKDAKSQAFCSVAAVWLSQQKDLKDKSGLKALLDINNGKSTAISDNAMHYQHLFSVVEASRTASGSLVLPAVPIAKLTNILDVELQNSVAAQQSEGVVEKERYFFVFGNKQQADEFANSILASLPAKFNTNIGTASEIFGKEFVQQKKMNGNNFVVEFTCGEYTGILPAQVVAKPSAPTTKAPVQEPGFTSKGMRISTKNTSESKPVTESDVSIYPRGQMVLKGSGDGKANVYGLAELWYAVKYSVDPKKDVERGKELIISAFSALLDKYGVPLKKEDSLEGFLASKDGQDFIKRFNADRPEVNGSASIEVFYDGKNYATLAAAIKENWKLGGDRGKLVYSQIARINEGLSKAGLSTLSISVSDIKPSLYFFQDLPAEVMDKLASDKSLPADLRSWLLANKNNLNGKAHMQSLLSYMEPMANTLEDPRNAYNKVSAALAKNDYALMNRLWLRTSANNEGLRVEDRNNQSLLVRAIEKSGDGASRSAAISTKFPATIEVIMDKLKNECLEVKKGDKASVSLGIIAVTSVKDTGTCINAYLVDGNNAVSPLEFNPLTKKYTAENLAPGEYSVVAYAQSSDGKITTSLVGQKFSVEEIVEPVIEKKIITPTRKARETRFGNAPLGFQPVGVSANLSIPGMPASSIDVQGSPILVGALTPLYNALSANSSNPVVDGNGYFHPDRMVTNLTGAQAVQFFQGLQNAINTWLNNPAVQTFIQSNLTNPSNYQAFITAMQNSNFIEAQSYLNPDQNSACRAELYQAFDGLANAKRLPVRFTLSDLSQLSKYNWLVAGSMQINLGKTVHKVTVKEDDDEGTRRALQVELIALGVPDKEQKKAIMLKSKNDQVYMKGKDGTYAVVKGGEGQYSVFQVPKIPTALYLYVQNNGYMLVTGDKVNVAQAGATLVGRIDIGGIDKFNIQPYLNANAQYQTTKGGEDSWLVSAERSSSVWANANAGAVAEYRFNQFISAIVSGGLGVAMGQFEPSYSGTLRAGTRLTPAKGLDIVLTLDRSLAPGKQPLDQVQGVVSYNNGRISGFAGAGVDTKKNIAGGYPFNVKVGFGVEL